MADQTKYANKLRAARILIIGGSSGIGYAVAEAAIESGAIVTLSSSNPKRVEVAISSLKKAYPSATDKIYGLIVDLINPDTLEKELETLLKKTIEGNGGKKLDHVVFTAGDALSMMKLEDFTMSTIQQAGQIRFFAPLLLAKFLPTYLNSSYTSSYTVTTGSISEKPMPDWSVIGAYAGGHHSMVRNLALDLKPIRVNCVSPGVVDTELWTMEGKERDDFLAKCAEGMVTGRPGQSEDVAESFLACLKDSNMSGSTVRTDGGAMLT
ncbi:short-chain dehydrogenase/reductase-like protein SDR [Dendryphion nanum]|uniref:Short-chain dehydrogenase/reductase-like protein SDR n=1 Tax=Dendryphion nanum TaxID=256645 RepID=A0A9P9DAR5_9PLEO|nr:short-chain dehydrogenase/reductase-like protein SDR [Dendryphion nanum]